MPSSVGTAVSSSKCARSRRSRVPYSLCAYQVFTSIGPLNNRSTPPLLQSASAAEGPYNSIPEAFQGYSYSGASPQFFRLLVQQ